MDPRLAIVPRLRLQLAGVPALLERVPRRDYDTRADDRWSVTETLAHLARYHEIWIDRVRMILAEDDPAFTAYTAETDPEWPAWQRQPFEQVMPLLQANRAALIDIVDRLTPDQWMRTGRHSRFGSLSVRAWLEFFLVHEGHHLYTIFSRARQSR